MAAARYPALAANAPEDSTDQPLFWAIFEQSQAVPLQYSQRLSVTIAPDYGNAEPNGSLTAHPPAQSQTK